MNLPHAFHLAALCLCLGTSLQTAAASPDDTQRPVREILAQMQGQVDQGCRAAGEAFESAAPADKEQAAMAQEMACGCTRKAIDAAYPVDGRAALIAQDAFAARLGGATQVCVDGAIQHRIEAACNRGVDPFARQGEAMPSARTQARCQCAIAKLSAAAGQDLVQAANTATADYTAQRARDPAYTPNLEQQQMQFLQQIQTTCAAADAPGR